MSTLHLDVMDYVVLVVILLVPVAMAVVLRFTGAKLKTTSDVLMGSRQMSCTPVAISLAISYISGITILGLSTEIYLHGITVVFTYVGLLLGMVCSLVFIVPIYHPLKITSINQYLMLRFNSRILVWFGWFANVLNGFLMNGIFLFAPSVVLEQALGISVNWCMVLVGVGATIYTSLGGYRVVIWTDVFQAVTILIGICYVIISGVLKCGGIEEAFVAYDNSGRFKIDASFSMYDRQTVLGLICSSYLAAIVKLGCSPTAVQRICSLPSQAQAKAMMAISGPLQVALSLLVILSGIITFGFYAINKCDPIRAGYIRNPNQILPYFVNDVMSYPGATGLFYSALICGSLSNLSSSLSSLTAVTWMDLFAHRFEKFSESNKVIVTTVITVILGLISLMMGVLMSGAGGTLLQIKFTVLTLPIPAILVMYFFSCFIPRLNWKSTLAGSVGGSVIVMWINIGNFLTKAHQESLPTDTSNCTDLRTHISGFTTATNSSVARIWDDVTTPSNITVTLDTPPSNTLSHMWFPKISFHYVGLIGVIVAVTVAVASSYLPGFCEEDHDMSVLSPFVRKFAKTRHMKESIKLREKEQQQRTDNESDDNHLLTDPTEC